MLAINPKMLPRLNLSFLAYPMWRRIRGRTDWVVTATDRYMEFYPSLTTS
jgi:hypothetical protein